MTITNYFDHHDRKASKEHFLHLIQAASVDGIIDNSESLLLHRIGKRLGFTDPEIEELIQKRDSKIYTPPYELEQRFNRLYDVVAMVLADGVFDASEVRLVKRLTAASHFSDDDADRLITLLVNGIENGKDEEELFLLFKRKK